MAALSFRNVVKRYGQGKQALQVIHGVDAEVEKGEFVVIVGPSGCGKSTLLRMIAGLEGITDGEIAISDNLLKRMADAYRRIRNTARYLLGNLDGFDPAHDAVPPAQMLLIDRWAVAQAAQLQDEIRQAYADAQFHLVYQKLHNYCVTDLGGLYLDVLKDRLYTTAPKSLARRSAQTALLHIAEAMVRSSPSSAVPTPSLQNRVTCISTAGKPFTCNCFTRAKS